MKNNIFNLIINDISKVYNYKNYKFLKNKRILITGATGLLGQYFIGFFLNSLQSKFKPQKITLVHKSDLPFYLKFLKKNKFFDIKKLIYLQKT